MPWEAEKLLEANEGRTNLYKQGSSAFTQSVGQLHPILKYIFIQLTNLEIWANTHLVDKTWLLLSRSNNVYYWPRECNESNCMEAKSRYRISSRDSILTIIIYEGLTRTSDMIPLTPAIISFLKKTKLNVIMCFGVGHRTRLQLELSILRDIIILVPSH